MHSCGLFKILTELPTHRAGPPMPGRNEYGLLAFNDSEFPRLIHLAQSNIGLRRRGTMGANRPVANSSLFGALHAKRRVARPPPRKFEAGTGQGPCFAKIDTSPDVITTRTFDRTAMMKRDRISARFWILALLGIALAGSVARAQTVTPPEQYFGFKIGSDRKLVRYDKIVEYLRYVASRSDRVRVRNLGATTQGNPFTLLEISSADTLKNLDHYKDLERKLYFQGGAPSEAERQQIFREGKAVVLVTNNIHSNEIGASQMVIELVYRLATEDSPEVKKVLDNDIFLLVPSLNPDGQIMVTDWYNKYVGSILEASQLPWIYHAYAGHDN